MYLALLPLKVTSTDVMASNGVIHVIDTVLIPPAEAEAELSGAAASKSGGVRHRNRHAA